jgi:ABC-type sulfate/molybdate transport systems ATPase subunit
VADNVRFAAELGEREPDVSRLLDLAGLNDSFADRPASKLSVGEQQRAMLARALALEPRVLLLDEPTSALDEGARGAVEATLLHLRDRVDVSTVLVTHDLAQARRMADWVVRLDEGRMVGEGPVREQLAVSGRPAPSTSASARSPRRWRSSRWPSRCRSGGGRTWRPTSGSPSSARRSS